MSGLFFHGVTRRFLDWLTMFRQNPTTLEFLPADDGPGGWGEPNQLFRRSCWELPPGHALVVTVPPIETFYWNFHLKNMWEESLDYRAHPVTLSKHTALYEPHGSARIVIASHDPG